MGPVCVENSIQWGDCRVDTCLETREQMTRIAFHLPDLTDESVNRMRHFEEMMLQNLEK